MSKIKTLVPIFVESTKLMLDNWKALEKQGPIDVDVWNRNLTFDVIGSIESVLVDVGPFCSCLPLLFEGRAGFGYDFKCLTGTTPEKRDFDKAVGGFINPIAFLFGSWLAKKLKTQARREIDAAVSRSEKVRSSGCHRRISRSLCDSAVVAQGRD